ncbi:hypothetical protein SCANM63S_09441 [Streptomyces canarius]
MRTPQLSARRVPSAASAPCDAVVTSPWSRAISARMLPSRARQVVARRSTARSSSASQASAAIAAGSAWATASRDMAANSRLRWSS